MDTLALGTAATCLSITVLTFLCVRTAGKRGARRKRAQYASLIVATATAKPALSDLEASEQKWNERLVSHRFDYLEHIRTTAGKWRDLFTGLLGLFGAVLVVGGAGDFADVPTSHKPVLFAVVLVTLILAINAVFYTGWAATGLVPKFGTAKNVGHLKELWYEHAGRSYTRLYAGLALGGLALVSAVVALGVTLHGHVISST